MPDLPTSVSTIIVSYNTCAMTRNCLVALTQATLGLSAEIVVVDNASADGTPHMIRDEFPGVSLIANTHNVGFGTANNQAFEVATGAYLLLLNSDTVVPSDCLHKLLSEAAGYRMLGALGCRLTNQDGSLQPSCWRTPSLINYALETFGLSRIFRRARNYQEWNYGTARAVDSVIGACMLIPRATLDDVGGFDERFFLYAEETDLCWRMRHAGYSVRYTPTVSVMHIGGGSSTAFSERRQNEFQRSLDLLMRKHYGRAGLIVYRVLALINVLLRLSAYAGVYAGLRLLRPAALPALTAKLRTYIHSLRWLLGRRSDLYLSTLDPVTPIHPLT